MQQCENLLSKVKENLNPKRCNFFYSSKDEYEQAPDILDILSELDISENEYYEVLSISSFNSCFVNNYFDESLLARKANISQIQPVFNHYKAVTYMCAYFKSEDETSESMKQAEKEAFNTNKTNIEQTRAIARNYSTKIECSVLEALYLIMPELWL